MKYIIVLARILFSFIFIMAGLKHFSSETIAYAASQHVPFASILVPASGLLAIIGGLSIMAGFKAKWGALLIIIFLIPVTLTMHNFWTISDPMMASMQQVMFVKNLAMLGGAILITYFGSGPLSLDELIPLSKKKLALQ